MRWRGWGVALGVVVLFTPSTAGATDPPSQQLRYDLRLDLPVTIVGLGFWGTSEFDKKAFASTSCKWCGVDGLDASVRHSLMWSSPTAADTVSNVMGFALIPIGAAGLDALMANHEGRLHSVPADLLVIAEATVLTGEVNQVVKFLAGRERPFVHALAPEEKLKTAAPYDNNVSFFSAHTSVSMALAVSTGTVGSMRGYSWAPLAWAILPPLSLLTGYLRIAADKHYFTDVITGAIVGAAIGFAVPYVFHRPTENATTATSAALTGPSTAATSVPTATMSWLW